MISALGDGADYRGLIRNYLTDPELVAGKQILIVVDGLDESASPELPGILFPFLPPVNVRIFAAARTIPDGGNWADRLHWDNELIQHFELDGLTKAGIQDVFFNEGNPLAHLGDQQDIINQLHRLSDQGDPFIVELYINELLRNKDGLQNLTVAELEKLKPGLKPFFIEWVNNQKKIWKDKGAGDVFALPHVRAFRDLLAYAKGGLRIYDLLHLDPEAFQGDAGRVREAAEIFERFVINDGEAQGYVYAHPRLGVHFADEVRFQKDALQNQFIKYGQETLIRLNEKRIKPIQARHDFTYILTYYREHLDDVTASPEQYYQLISEGWLKAWEALEGTYNGFLGDVDAVWDKARQPDNPNYPIQILAALCHSSIATMGSNIGGQILLALWKRRTKDGNRYLSNIQLRNQIEQISSPFIRLDAIFESVEAFQSFPESTYYLYVHEVASFIQRYLPQEELANAFDDLFTEETTDEDQAQFNFFLLIIKEMINQTSDPYLKAMLLTATFIHSPAEKNADDLNKIVRLTQSFPDEFEKAKLLVTLLPHLIEAGLQATVDQMLIMIRAIEDEQQKTDLLILLVPHLPLAALETARLLGDLPQKVKLLAAVTPHLPADSKQVVFDEMLQTAQAIPDAVARAETFAAIAEQFEAAQKERLTIEGARAALEVPNISRQIELLATLLPALPEDERKQVAEKLLDTIEHSSDERQKIEILKLLAPYSPKTVFDLSLILSDQIQKLELFKLLAEHLPVLVLAETQQFSDTSIKRDLLILLAPHLPQPVLEVVREIDYAWYKTDPLIALAPHLPKEILAEVVNFSDEEDVTNLLIALTPHIPAEVLTTTRELTKNVEKPKVWAALLDHLPDGEKQQAAEEILNSASTIPQAGSFLGQSKAELFKSLIPYLPDEQKSKAAYEALNATREMSSEWQRADILKSLIPDLSEADLGTVTEIARKISDQQQVANIPSAFIAALPETENQKLFQDALQMTEQVPDEGIRARILLTLVAHIPEMVLTASENFTDETHKTSILIALAPHLPEAVQNAVQRIAEQNKKMEVWQALAPHIPESIFSIAQNLTYEPSRDELLRALIPYLPERVFEMTQTISSSLSRETLLVKLAPVLPEKVLKVTDDISLEGPRSTILKALAPYLPERILIASNDIEDPLSKTGVMIATLDYLSGETQQQVLQEALALYSNLSLYEKTDLSMVALIKHLPENEQFQIARGALDETHFYTFEEQKLFFAHLPESERKNIQREDLDKIKSYTDEYRIARELEPLVPELPDEVLEITNRLSNEHQRTELLVALSSTYSSKGNNKCRKFDRAISNGRRAGRTRTSFTQ